MWSDFKSLGVLPYDGALGEQPAFVFEAIKAIDDLKTQLDSERPDHGAV